MYTPPLALAESQTGQYVLTVRSVIVEVAGRVEVTVQLVVDCAYATAAQARARTKDFMMSVRFLVKRVTGTKGVLMSTEHDGRR